MQNNCCCTLVVMKDNIDVLIEVHQQEPGCSSNNSREYLNQNDSLMILASPLMNHCTKIHTNLMPK